MTKIIQSKELTSFYNAYNEWLEAGAPEHNDYRFLRSVGLCSALRKYSSIRKWAGVFKHVISQENIDIDIDNLMVCDKTISLEMESQFDKANLDTKYPFGEIEFCRGVQHESNYLDPNRIRWVKAHLTEEVDMESTLQE